MKYSAIIFISLFLLYCAPSQDLEKLIEQRLALVEEVTFDHFEDCQIYQFFGTDSLSGAVALSVAYNSDGAIVGRNFEGYHSSRSTRKGGKGKEILTYDSEKRLVESTYYGNGSDPGSVHKDFYFYSEDGLLAQEVGYSFERPLRSNAKERLFGGDHIISDADFEEHRVWEKTSNFRFKYNEKGQVVEKYSSDIPGYYYNERDINYYDTEGRKIEDQSFINDKLGRTRKYEYFEGGYSYEIIWPLNDKLLGVSKEPRIPFKYIIQLNELGKVVEESIMHGIDLRQRKIIQYDEAGRILRSTIYGEDSKLELTHVYRYGEKQLAYRCCKPCGL